MSGEGPIETPWWRPETGTEALPEITRLLASGFPNEGETTATFEARVAAITGASHAIATTSGTAAIFLALAGLGVGQGDEVLVPDLTFIATANAVRLTGASVVLVDVDEATLCMDPDAAERAITPRTRAIVPVHVSGRSADLGSLQAVAERRDLVLVEDAAEAFASFAGGACLGTRAHAGIYSFSPHKIATCGQGGMVVTQDAALASRIRGLKDHGRLARGTGGDDLHPTLGFNFKLTNIQSAVALAELERLSERALRLRRRHELYREHLHSLRLFPFGAQELPLWTDAASPDRDALVRHLREHGMETRNFWHPLHTQPPYRRDDADFPVASRLSRELFWLPSAFQLTDPQVLRVCEVTEAFLARG